MRFIRVHGRVVPVGEKIANNKSSLLKKRLATAAVFVPTIAAAGYGAGKGISATFHINQAMQSYKKAVVAKAFGMSGDYSVFKAAARKSAFAYKAASKASLAGAAVFTAGLAGIAALGYNRRNKNGK